MGQSNPRRHTTNTMMLALVFTICIAIVSPFTVNRQDYTVIAGRSGSSGSDIGGSDYYGYGYEYGSGSDVDGSDYFGRLGSSGSNIGGSDYYGYGYEYGSGSDVDGSDYFG